MDRTGEIKAVILPAGEKRSDSASVRNAVIAYVMNEKWIDPGAPGADVGAVQREYPWDLWREGDE